MSAFSSAFHLRKFGFNARKVGLRCQVLVAAFNPAYPFAE